MSHDSHLIHGGSVIHSVLVLAEGGQAGEQQLYHVHQSGLRIVTKQLWRKEWTLKEMALWSSDFTTLSLALSLSLSPSLSFPPPFLPPSLSPSHSPLSLISKQILKHDCIISHTLSLLSNRPTGVSIRVCNTYSKQRRQHTLTYHTSHTHLSHITQPHIHIHVHVPLILTHNSHHSSSHYHTQLHVW